MAKYKVLFAEKKQTSTGKDMFKVTLVDEQDSKTELNMFDVVTVGQELDGEIYVNDKGYKNFKSSTAKSNARPNVERLMEKKASTIQEFQGNKQEAIAQSQDRNMWMWSKYSACELYANDRVGSKLESDDEAMVTINRIATKIYHMEPLTPFE